MPRTNDERRRDRDRRRHDRASDAEELEREERRRRRRQRRHNKEPPKPQGCCGPRLRLSFKSILCNVLESVFIFLAIAFASAGFLTYDWISTDKESMQKVEIYPPINAPGFQTVSCGLTSFCIDAAGQLSECSIPWPRYGGGTFIDVDAYPSRLWAAAAGCVAGGIGLMSLAWLYTLVACFGCFRERIHRLSLRVLELGGVFLAAGIICFGFTLGSTGVSDDRCISRDSSGDCDSWTATLPSEKIEGKNASCQFCPQTGQFQMSTACSFGWGGLAVIIAVVLVGLAATIGGHVTPRKKQVKYRWAFSTRRKKKNKAGKVDRRRSRGSAGDTRGIVHTGERVVLEQPDIVTRLNEIDDTSAAEDAANRSEFDGVWNGPTVNAAADSGFVNVIPNHLVAPPDEDTPPPPPPVSTIPGRMERLSGQAHVVGSGPMYATPDSDAPTPSAPPAAGALAGTQRSSRSLMLADGDTLHEVSDTDLRRLMGGSKLSETSNTDDETTESAHLVGAAALDECSDTDGSPLKRDTTGHLPMAAEEGHTINETDYDLPTLGAAAPKVTQIPSDLEYDPMPLRVAPPVSGTGVDGGYRMADAVEVPPPHLYQAPTAAATGHDYREVGALDDSDNKSKGTATSSVASDYRNVDGLDDAESAVVASITGVVSHPRPEGLIHGSPQDLAFAEGLAVAHDMTMARTASPIVGASAERVFPPEEDPQPSSRTAAPTSPMGQSPERSITPAESAAQEPAAAAAASPTSPDGGSPDRTVTPAESAAQEPAAAAAASPTSPDGGSPDRTVTPAESAAQEPAATTSSASVSLEGTPHTVLPAASRVSDLGAAGVSTDVAADSSADPGSDDELPALPTAGTTAEAVLATAAVPDDSALASPTIARLSDTEATRSNDSVTPTVHDSIGAVKRDTASAGTPTALDCERVLAEPPLATGAVHRTGAGPAPHYDGPPRASLQSWRIEECAIESDGGDTDTDRIEEADDTVPRRPSGVSEAWL